MTFEWDVIRTGLLNTVLGMGTVFAVLIFIILLISAFKFIPRIQEKFQKTPELPPMVHKPEIISAATEPPVQIIEEISEELVDDLELVAVITAAITASMGDEVPEDGLIVRSIKRANTNKWQRA